MEIVGLGQLKRQDAIPKYPSLNLAPHMLMNHYNLIRFLCAVIAVDLRQTVQVDEDLQIRAYYAGHVRLFELHLLGMQFGFSSSLLEDMKRKRQ